MTDPHSNRKHVTFAGARKDRGLECPKCGCYDTRVLRTRHTNGRIRRVRECGNDQCRHKFNTYES